MRQLRGTAVMNCRRGRPSLWTKSTDDSQTLGQGSGRKRSKGDLHTTPSAELGAADLERAARGDRRPPPRRVDEGVAKEQGRLRVLLFSEYWGKCVSSSGDLS